MPTYEGLRLKILKFYRKEKIFVSKRLKKLETTNFSIISNNCWGGMVYESYNLKKQSPTVGAFFMASDYIKFVSDLKGYTTGNISFINPYDSRWKDNPQVCNDKRFGTYPIGVVSNGKFDIEIFFLHYHSEEEAAEEWKKRCERIIWNKLLIKFNDQNGCSEKDVNDFIELPYKNKIFFTCKDWNVNSKIIVKIKQPFNKDYVQASYEPFGKNKNFDVTGWLNNLESEDYYE